MSETRERADRSEKLAGRIMDIITGDVAVDLCALGGCAASLIAASGNRVMAREMLETMIEGALADIDGRAQ